MFATFPFLQYSIFFIMHCTYQLATLQMWPFKVTSLHYIQDVLIYTADERNIHCVDEVCMKIISATKYNSYRN